MKQTILLFVLLVHLIACHKEKVNRFSDTELTRLATFQDQRAKDSLLQFFHHPEPEVRRSAVLAFASIQDAGVAVDIGNILLEDTDSTVRRAAAFALGQVEGFNSVNALMAAVNDSNPQVRAEVIESLGKTILQRDVSAIDGRHEKDTVVIVGYAWAAYRAGLRGITDTSLVNRARVILQSAQIQPAQLASAHFLSRSNYPTTLGLEEALSRAIRSWKAEVRMPAVTALRKFSGDNIVRQLNNLLEGEDDYRVWVNTMRTIGVFSWDKSESFFARGLLHENSNVGIAAAEVMRTKGTAENLPVILKWARASTNGRVRALLYEAVLAVKPDVEIEKEVKDLYARTEDNYEKAWLLGTLSKSFSAYPFLRDELINSHVPVIKSSATAALTAMNQSRSFPTDLKGEFGSIFRQAIESGDQGAIVSACDALRDTTLGYQQHIKDYSFLATAQQKLEMPKDYEAYQALQETIAYFEGSPPPPAPKNEFNHPINSSLLSTIPSGQQVLIETTKGKIIMQLFIDEAPGSVVNFVELLNQKYFDGKYFHRVVPNFVIQTGCNRGDGFGSEDYSIRSEFTPRRYKTGSVGMASAGKDTEGTQWFITHSPTPHLDGRYTIFAEVVSGMEVVHKIEVGDQILHATLIRN